MHKEFKTSHKAFDRHPFNDLELVKSGAHYERLVAALDAYDSRPYQHQLLVGGLSRLLSDSFVGGGLVRVRSWLSPKLHKELLSTAQAYPAHMNKHDQVILSKQRPRCLVELFRESQLKEMLACCLKVNIDHRDFSNQYENNTFIQKVVFDGENDDEQMFAHMDTFYPSLKFWYFLEDVEPDYGAFSYAEYSPTKFRTKEFADWYNAQILGVVDGSYDGSRGRGTPEGSLRITLDEMTQLGVSYKPVCVKANTLVIGNVMGFHGRGISKKSLTRTAIHGSIRLNSPME